MDAVVPHLDGWAEVQLWPKYLSTFLLSVHSYLCHLFLQLDYHRMVPSRQRVTAVTCHLIYRVQPFGDPVNLELLAYLFVIASYRVLL